LDSAAAAIIGPDTFSFFASVDESCASVVSRPEAKICAYFANAQVETRPRFGDDDGDPIT
jgi:hypothetical protein